ncbi:hypothetical protein [Dongia rigui]|uniref:Uncharacterized protein n=1 Tax=Dongia rigui TaxID=940149 RepID=A0ABU5DZQ5_9PROT|nr:hypothetical protein [Dongia rigui]MDY0872026.1 hypothetical protein [Dongia rigui]
MGVQLRQNPKSLQMKGVIATMAPDKQPPAPRMVKRANATAIASPAATLAALADIYGRIADMLLERIHDDLRHAQALGQHLDWVAARAQMVASFHQAGDCAMTYICASPDAYARLVPLVELTAQQLTKRKNLALALYLIERIDEELRLV